MDGDLIYKVELELNGDIKKLIENKTILKHPTLSINQLVNTSNLKKYKREYRTEISIPESLRSITNVCGINVTEEITIDNDKIKCIINSPDSIKKYFDFREEIIYMSDGNTLTCKFSSTGKVLSLAKPFTTLIWDLYKSRRIEKIKDELRNTLETNRWGVGNFIMQ